jgi:hypothetical protein
MSNTTPPTHDGLPFHTAPLRHLVKRVLHPGRTLADNVIRLRWKRRKVKAPIIDVGDITLATCPHCKTTGPCGCMGKVKAPEVTL